MPRIKDDDVQVNKIGGSNFSFSSKRLEDLASASSEYTLVTLAVDETGSISGYEDDLKQMVEEALSACMKSPHADNLLVRLIGFGSQHHMGVKEFFGFTPLNEINKGDLPQFEGGGMTPLCDACFSAIGATNELAAQLWEEEGCASNGIVFIITDGDDNQSIETPRSVKEQALKAIRSEDGLESLVSVLIGINAVQYKSELENFYQNAGLTQYTDAGDVTPSSLAKLAAFISQSISSQSQALGTGGPSQNISATI